ncbi:unnamed protein product [Adineta ricciae]|uniref:Uncharacterized protein n=1 Tax=Adineta ricciae TaxID=249248 RepID=A0A815WJJ1_ADIRI|nr:unnamed protein product [Adineta ricciae]CAF1541658.1 unnamed protein product [Adineta ricciae]
MATSCNTHSYDGKLREKWFEIRPMLIEKYLPHCLSFDDTLKDIERWLDRKYFNVKRIGRARRSLRILTTHRRTNFDTRNDIDVEELLPILWNQVKKQADIHDTFYEQLCDITGGSCSQGRSTRLFQFLFLFDLPIETSTNNDEQKDSSEIVKKTDEQNDTSQTIVNENDQKDSAKIEADVEEQKNLPETETNIDVQKDQSQTETNENNPVSTKEHSEVSQKSTEESNNLISDKT